MKTIEISELKLINEFLAWFRQTHRALNVKFSLILKINFGKNGKKQMRNLDKKEGAKWLPFSLSIQTIFF